MHPTGIGRALKHEHAAAERRLAEHQRRRPRGSQRDVNYEIESAMGLLDQLEKVMSDPDARGEINGLVKKLGIRLGLDFVEGIKGTERKVRKLSSGILVTGDAELPVPLYGNLNRQGPNSHSEPVAVGTRPTPTGADADVSMNEAQDGGRPALTGGSAADGDSDVGSFSKRRREGVSSTKVNRGDWIRTSDLSVPNPPKDHAEKPRNPLSFTYLPRRVAFRNRYYSTAFLSVVSRYNRIKTVHTVFAQPSTEASNKGVIAPGHALRR